MEHINSQQGANALASTKQMKDELALATVTNEKPRFREGAAIFAIGVFTSIPQPQPRSLQSFPTKHCSVKSKISSVFHPSS